MRELMKYYESEEDRHQEYDDEVYRIIQCIEYQQLLTTIKDGDYYE